MKQNAKRRDKRKKMMGMARMLALLWLLWAGMLPAASHAAAPQLQVRDSFVIPADKVGGIAVSELSGLAWDQDEQLLYAVSDRGIVFHFRVDLAGGKIAAVEPVFAARLLDSKGQEIKKGRRDSEGLAVLNAANGKPGDTQLVISFEGEPRVVTFTPAGQAIQNLIVPDALRERKRLRHGNDGLEAVTLHSRYGVITAPEMPLKGQPENLHTVYSSKGKQWSFMAYPAPNSGISALEALPDGNLLVLERAWSGFPNPLVVSLRYLDFQQCPKKGACSVQDLQVFSSHFLVDNYEGLTHVSGNQYLMVSDDGGGDWQRTILTLFTLD
jgi:hypothetical protein